MATEWIDWRPHFQAIEEATPQLRWQPRYDPTAKQVVRHLQQFWKITELRGDGQAKDIRLEWRDVPEIRD